MDHTMQEIPDIAVIVFMAWVAVNLGLPKKIAPLLAWIMGIIIAFFSSDKGGFLEILYYGTFLAASAVGFHSGSKNTIQNFRNGIEDEKNDT